MRIALVAALVLLSVSGIAASVDRALVAWRRDHPPEQTTLTDWERQKLAVVTSLVQMPAGQQQDFEASTVEIERKLARHRSLTLLHVVPGALVLLLAPLQFVGRIRRRYVAYHRWAGRLILTAVAISGVAGLVFGFFFPFAGAGERLVTTLVGIGFLYCAIRAWLNIRWRRPAQHREWMLRMYAIAIGIATVRLVSFTTAFIPGISVRDAFVLSLWVGWALSLGVAEFWIRRTRPVLARSPVPLQIIATDIL